MNVICIVFDGKPYEFIFPNSQVAAEQLRSAWLFALYVASTSTLHTSMVGGDIAQGFQQR